MFVSALSLVSKVQNFRFYPSKCCIRRTEKSDFIDMNMLGPKRSVRCVPYKFTKHVTENNILKQSIFVPPGP